MDSITFQESEGKIQSAAESQNIPKAGGASKRQAEPVSKPSKPTAPPTSPKKAKLSDETIDGKTKQAVKEPEDPWPKWDDGQVLFQNEPPKPPE